MSSFVIVTSKHYRSHLKRIISIKWYSNLKERKEYKRKEYVEEAVLCKIFKNRATEVGCSYTTPIPS